MNRGIRRKLLASLLTAAMLISSLGTLAVAQPDGEATSAAAEHVETDNTTGDATDAPEAVSAAPSEVALAEEAPAATETEAPETSVAVELTQPATSEPVVEETTAATTPPPTTTPPTTLEPAPTETPTMEATTAEATTAEETTAEGPPEPAEPSERDDSSERIDTPDVNETTVADETTETVETTEVTETTEVVETTETVDEPNDIDEEETEPVASSDESGDKTEDEPELGDNPDGLAEPLVLPDGDPIDYSQQPNVRRRNAIRRLPSSPPVIGEDHPTQPGEVMLFKEAKPVPGLVNAWDVTLRIEGKDDVKTSDIVLVFDRSGSMHGDRMTAAKDAAKKFVDALLVDDDSRHRIALVSFASNVTVNVGLTNEKETLHNAIDGLIAYGGTYTQAAIRQAATILNGSNADHKNIVLLSDGVPTYSYRLHNPNQWLSRIPDTNNLFETNTNPNAAAFDYGRTVGDGTSLRTPFAPYSNNYYNHGHSAIAESGFFKNAALNQVMWTVAFQAGTTGTPLLNQMASPGKAYTASSGDLSAIFTDIAGKITAAVSDAIVDDPMGTGFSIPASFTDQIYVSQGTATYNADTKAIDWNVGSLATPIEPGSPIRYAELTYRVEIDDSILDVDEPEDGQYPTNGRTTLRYTNTDGQEVSSDFPSPKVNPILMIVEKKLIDSHGQVLTDDPRIFVIEVTNNKTGDAAYHQTHRIKAGERRIMTNLRNQDTYTVEEIAINADEHTAYESKLSDYDIAITINGTPASSFTLREDDPDRTILVTNTEKALGKLTVYKVFNPQASISNVGFGLFAIPEFSFTVTGPDGYETTFTLKANESHELTDLPYGDYTVTETDTQGFVATYDPGQTVNLSITKKEASVIVTNRPESNDDTITVVGKKVWRGGPEEDHIAVTMRLVRNGMVLPNDEQPIYTVEPKEGTAYTFTYTWTELPKYDENGAEYTYSIQEPGFIPRYVSTTSDNGLTITNTYEPDTDGEATATKSWDGGPSQRPTVWFKLYRKVADEAEVAVPGANILELKDGTTSVTWTDLTVQNPNGVVYTYFVKEVDADGNDFTPENYEKAEVGLTVTNTYVIPKKNVTATKEWIDGPEDDRPDIWFKLYRKTEDTPVEEVPEAHVKRVTGNSVTWEDIEQTDKNGTPYTFSVKEVDADGNDFTPENYTKKEDGQKVTNTYVPPIKTLEAIKTWVDGPETRPTIGVRLHRYIGDGPADPEVDAIASATTVMLTSGVMTAEWRMPTTDEQGRRYTYYVKEMVQDGDYEAGVIPKLIYGAPDNYDLVESGMKLTNTYVIPADGSVTATKKWVGGPIQKPTIWFQLQRRIASQSDASAFGAAIIELPDGTTSATWKDLEQTDRDGNPYIFSVVEGTFIDVDGEEQFRPGPPDKYILSIGDNYTLTNLFVPGTKDMRVKKVWQNGPESKPAVTIKLQRSLDGESFTDYLSAVLDGEMDGPDESGSGELEPWIYTWANVPQEDNLGQAYRFKVVEEPVAHYETTYPPVGDQDDVDFIITNSYDPPSDGVLTVIKVWKDHPDEVSHRPSVEVELSGNGKTFEHTLTADEEWKHTFTGLPETDLDGKLIDYTVRELVSEGFAYAIHYARNEDGAWTITNSQPILEVEKEADKSAYKTLGETITYTVTVTNSGYVALTNISMTDSLVDISALTPTKPDGDDDLGIGESWVYTYSYDVTQADLNRGFIDNTATASAKTVLDDEDRMIDVSGADSLSVSATQAPDMTVEKTSTETSYDAVGDVLNYTVVVTNTGNISLTGVVVTDSLVDLRAVVPTESMTNDGVLEVGETWTYTYTYTVTQVDLDAGSVLNKVNASSEETPEDPDNPIEDEVEVPAEQTPGMTVEKTATEDSYDAVGDVLHYTVVVTNTGNISLTDVVVTDSLVDLSAVVPTESMNADGVLEVGETWTYTYTYTVTQADLDAGRVLNKVNASSEETPEDPDNPIEDEVEVPAEQKPRITVYKAADEASFQSAGDVLHYTVLVMNTGNVSLTKVVVTDSLVDLSAVTPIESMTNDGVLEVGETWTYTYSYTVVQADVERGYVLNRAAATEPGVPDDDPDHPNEDENEVIHDGLARMAVVKKVAQTSYSTLGELLDYTVVVRNTGNVKLTAIDVRDSLVDLSAIVPTESMTNDGVLEVGEIWTYTYRYEVTQADLDRGSLLNRVTATSPDLPDGPDNPVEDVVEIPAEQIRAVEVTKVAQEFSFRKAGEILHYTVQITNLGNINLTGVVLTDSLVDLSAVAAIESANADGVLEVGETWTYLYRYPVTVDDAARGYVLNRVSATTDQTPDRPVDAEHRVERETPPAVKPAPRTGSSSQRPLAGLLLLLLGGASLVLYRRRKRGEAKQN